MESFKIEHFHRDKPGRLFPWFEPAPAVETQAIRAALARKAGLPSETEALTLTRRLDALGTVVEGLDAETEGFDLAATFFALAIRPQGGVVYVNWHRYDVVDRMKFTDLASHLDDVWYPSSDDIDIFDATLSWIVSIAHEGTIKVARFEAEGKA